MYRILQTISILFISLYTYLTFPTYLLNWLWFLLALLLFIFGTALKPHHSILTAVGVVLVYAGFHMVMLYIGKDTVEFGWNSILWLIIFPFATFMGAFHKTVKPKQGEQVETSLFQMLRPASSEARIEENHLDESLGFLSATSFIYRLEDEVIASLREKKEFVLLLIVIDKFSDYKSVVGFEASQLLLHQVAKQLSSEALEEHIVVKAHLGDGVLAVILPELNLDVNAVIEVEAGLNAFFTDLLMHKPRRESQVKIKLVFGSALCPADGIEARSLMDKAQSDIEGIVSRT